MHWKSFVERACGWVSIGLLGRLLYSLNCFLVKPALMWGDNSSIDSESMWGDNSSIDSGVSFFRWSMMVTSARFSCFVPSFLHQSALVFWCYALVLGDQISYAVMLLCSVPSRSGFLCAMEFGWCLFTGLQLGSPWCSFWLCSLYLGPPCAAIHFLKKRNIVFGGWNIL
ncbi:hypothetical protein HID58_091265 [Brassica napus]|uniref:Uncharacterized protein n=1 Tax=Brassica napus TaxID=3708 RepID=A0ABQ7X489_BRANA|nr:hypothetical protein HID58_091265 [Brassica napus]